MSGWRDRGDRGLLASVTAMDPGGRDGSAGRQRGGDRVFKWVAAIGGACLVGFVVFVVVRGPSHPTGGNTASW